MLSMGRIIVSVKKYPASGIDVLSQALLAGLIVIFFFAVL